MNIEVVLSPSLYDGRATKQHHITVAVDILRATSAICAAFSAGVDEIVPLDSLEPLAQYSKLGYTLAAERNGEKVQGATCGNSPTEYLTMKLDVRRLAYSTTNGTVSILRAAGSDRLFVGAFANLSALAGTIAADPSHDALVVLCSGWKGDPSLEDTLFAGALIDFLGRRGVDTTLVNDAAFMARELWKNAAADPYGYCRNATHVHRLQKLGYDRDIRWAFVADTCPLVPFYDNGKLRINV